MGWLYVIAPDGGITIANNTLDRIQPVLDEPTLAEPARPAILGDHAPGFRRPSRRVLDGGNGAGPRVRSASPVARFGTPWRLLSLAAVRRPCGAR